ncbi:hypothetical protein V500_07454 [Pseudogymnoascus sp. VKM F-4518 (FW-2643)]|nr:hypothetical protein V500_07454 [Pseudogymnoascus sp. VKM F-4518 (FW-2643)]
MPTLRLTLNQQRPHDIAHTVRHKDRRSHEALLRVPRHIRHPYRDHETHHRPKRPDDAVPRHRRDGANRLKRRPAEGAHNQRPKAGDRAVDSVCAGHHEEDEIGLWIEEGLANLSRLELLASQPRLPASQPLSCHDLLLRGKEPSRRGAARDEETPDAEEDGEAAGEEVDVLPPLQRAACDLAEAVVDGAADDGEEARAGEPPGLPQRLLLLRVVPGDDGHEGGGDDGLDEAEEEALDEEALEGCYGGSEHAD